MFVHSLEEASCVQLGDDAPASIEPVEPLEALRHVAIQRRARGEDVDLRQSVTQSDLVVVEIVCGRDLDDPGTECRIDVGIGNDRNRASGERQSHGFPNQTAVALVIGIYRDPRVAEHRFRTRGGDHDVPGSVLQRIAKMPQPSIFLFALHFQIGQCGE